MSGTTGATGTTGTRGSRGIGDQSDQGTQGPATGTKDQRGTTHMGHMDQGPETSDQGLRWTLTHSAAFALLVILW